MRPVLFPSGVVFPDETRAAQFLCRLHEPPCDRTLEALNLSVVLRATGRNAYQNSSVDQQRLQGGDKPCASAFS